MDLGVVVSLGLELGRNPERGQMDGLVLHRQSRRPRWTDFFTGGTATLHFGDLRHQIVNTVGRTNRDQVWQLPSPR